LADVVDRLNQPFARNALELQQDLAAVHAKDPGEPFVTVRTTALENVLSALASALRRVGNLEAEIAQLPSCGKAPSDLVRRIGFGMPCHLHQGHSGQCRHRQKDREFVEHVQEAVGDVAPAE
jgi:hypothetical protein